MINYHIHKPIKLNNVFEIPADTTKWEYEYNTIKKPWTPKRKAKFSFEELLIVKKQTGYLNLVNGHGIYILYFSTSINSMLVYLLNNLKLQILFCLD